MLILFSLLSISSAVKLADTQFTLSANPQQGFKLLTWLTLAPEFLKDARLVVAEFACNVNKDGTLRFRHLNMPQYVWGDTEDEKAVAQQVLSKTRLKVGAVTASCDSGKLVVQVTPPGNLATIFPNLPLDAAVVEIQRNLDISPDVTFGAGGLRVMRVPFPFTLKGGVLSTPETASGLAMGVTQLGVLKPLANGTQAMPVSIEPALPYTLHVIAGKSYNLTVSGSQLTGWVNDKP
ncbi:hypothetical protein [Deinococcus frigens]|uniref:hypothetical protein n=1 Tax=Deinococcus frigens TaxID=249403 RepID=UPI0012EC98A6|nr:hypothetical protein [Deinococcus frigens]